MRAGSTTPRPTATVWWQGVHLAALAVLTYAGASSVRLALMWIGGPPGVVDLLAGKLYGPYIRETWLPLGLAPAVLLVATLVALVAGYGRVAAVLAAAAGVVPTVLQSNDTIERSPMLWFVWWGPALAVILIVASLRRPADVPAVGRGTGWLLVAATAGTTLVPRWELPLPLILAAAALLLSAVLWLGSADPRILTALAALACLKVLTEIETDGRTYIWMVHTYTPGYGIAATALLIAAAVQTRRHARV